MHANAHSGAKVSLSSVSMNGIGGHQAKSGKKETGRVHLVTNGSLLYSAEDAQKLQLLNHEDLDYIVNGPFPPHTSCNEWLLNGEEPSTHKDNHDHLTWLHRSAESAELSSQKRNLVYALDIIAKGYARNKLSMSNAPSDYSLVTSANSVAAYNGYPNVTNLTNGTNSHKGARDPSPGSFQNGATSSANQNGKSKDMTDIQVLVKMQEEELRMSYQTRENAGNSSFLIRRDSQDSLDDTTMQAEIDYRPYQQPNTNARRRSRTHSRDRGPVTERSWDFVGLGKSSNVGGSSPQLEKGAQGRIRSRSRTSVDSNEDGPYRQMRSTLGVPTMKRKSNREMLEEASRARAAATANQQKSLGNRSRQGTYNASQLQNEIVTGGGDFMSGEAPIEIVSAPPPLPKQPRSRRRSYSVEHYNPQAPTINSSQENLQIPRSSSFGVESRESLPGTKPAFRGRSGRRDSGEPVTAAGDEGLNDSVFASPAATGGVVPIIRGRSASSGINIAGGAGQRSRQNSFTKALNGSFTKLNSAFSNELIPRVPSRDSLTRRGSLGGDSSRRGADLSSSESCPGAESPTPYHTPRTSRPPVEIATESGQSRNGVSAPQTATVRKPRRMRPPNEQNLSNNQIVQNTVEPSSAGRAKPGVRPPGRGMTSVRGMAHSSPAGNVTPERRSPASLINSPASRMSPKTVVKDQTNRRMVKPDDVKDQMRRSSRILSTPETRKRRTTVTKGQISDDDMPPVAVSTSSLPIQRPLRALPNGGLPNHGPFSSQDSLNSTCSSAASADSLMAEKNHRAMPFIPPPLPPRHRLSLIVPPKARKSQLKKPGQESTSSAGTSRRTIPKRPNDSSVPNLTSKSNSQPTTKNSSPQPSNAKPTQSKMTSRPSEFGASGKFASSSTGSLSQRAGASDNNSTMPLEKSAQMSRSSNFGKNVAGGGGEVTQKQGRASMLPTAKTSSIPGPRSAARGRRQLPKVPTDSVASSENIYEPQMNAHPYPTIADTSQDLPLQEQLPQQQQRHIYATNKLTELNDRCQAIQRPNVQSSNKSAFRLVKPIAQRPNQSQPNMISGGDGGGKEQYSSAPAQVTVVGEDAILPLKYLVPAHGRDSPSLLDVYSGDEIFDGNDGSLSQWDDGCF